MIRRLYSRIWWRYHEWLADRDYAAGRYDTYETAAEARAAMRSLQFRSDAWNRD